MIWQKELVLKPYPRGYHLITENIAAALPELPDKGMLNILIKHTSASLSLNENADPSVRHDLENFMNLLVPENHSVYRHTDEGPDDMPAHIKSGLMGATLTIPVTNGQLNLGIWQGIYLCEFRNVGGSRKLVITLWW